MQEPGNITKHELIGLIIRISKSKNKGFISVEGKVVDETKNLLIIKTDNGEKKIPKKENTFEVQLPGGKVVEVQGTLLIGKPESRLKNLMSKKRV